MDCESQQLMISKLSDGELPAEESAALFIHLGTCPACREFYGQLHRLTRVLDRERDAVIPAPPVTAQRGYPHRTRMWTTMVRVPLVIVALLVGSLLFSLYFSFRKSTGSEMVYLVTLPQIVVHGN